MKSLIPRESVDKDFIGQLLGSFDEIYRDDVKSYQKRELLCGALARIELCDNLLKVGVWLEKSNGTSNGNTGLISISTSNRGVMFDKGVTPRSNSFLFLEQKFFLNCWACGCRRLPDNP